MSTDTPHARVIDSDEGKRIEYLADGPTTTQFDLQQIPKLNVTQEMLRNSGDDPETWLMYGGGYRQQRFTTAEVISPENVSDLSLEYLIEVPKEQRGKLEGTPIVVPSDPPIMYQTNAPDVVRAVNARSGEIIWEYQFAPKEQEKAPLLCCGSNNRGAAVLGGTLYMTTLTADVVAINRYTGEQKWVYNSAPTGQGYSATWAPVVYEGSILNGSAGGEYGVQGFIESIDAETGEREWRTSMLPPEQWIGDAWKNGAATNWMTVTVDPDTDTLYANVGNPGPDVNGIVRPGPNVYSNAVVALDVTNGDVNWYFQESQHGWWDWDASAPPVVFETEVDGEQRKVVSHPGKTGWNYLLDAQNGKLYERSREFCEHLNMWHLPQDNLEDTPWIMPSADGGSEWNPVSYSRATGNVHVKAMNYPSKFQWDPVDEWEYPSTYLGGNFTVYPAMEDPGPPPEQWSQNLAIFSAVNPETGEVVWQDEWEQFALGGSMSTATGLTFVGNGAGEFIAYDSETGERLWQYQFDASINASPMSWYDPAVGKQYVAVQAGGGGLRSVKDGNEIGVFSLEQ
ncbi:PQQ-binding-like beta-propeller repeat protein [Halorussus gelatinilyticus]|uniref:PQQ-binding-like beta-propeller repeat protein n=1 Tax=Halorussus gelatinilyticus TaxID=2937524 RepID=A0A8U0IDH4_9EURY|nr:PQQ-binding-like beta-propeller repeat protein [Halorussus gelatinilyticus]UPV98760.1 PQQ-binding-like beta-propeller repeat protein [Halorussus gelatinilyticus]